MPGTLRAGQGAAINRERKEAEAKAAIEVEAEAEAPVEEKSTKATPKRARKEKE